MYFSHVNLHLNVLKGCDLASLNLSQEVISIFDGLGHPQPSFYEKAVWRKNGEERSYQNAEQIDRICGTNLRKMPFAQRWLPDDVCRELLGEEVHDIIVAIKRSDTENSTALN